MLNQLEHAKKIEELRSRWDQAEGLNKFAESLRPALIAPVIAELRYAGRYVLDALGPDVGDAEALTRLDIAIYHCRTAYMDAADVCVAFMDASISRAQRDYGIAKIIESNPDFPALLSELRHVESLIRESRRDRTSRIQYYDQVELSIPELVNRFNKIELPKVKRLTLQDGIFQSISLSLTASCIAALVFHLLPLQKLHIEHTTYLALYLGALVLVLAISVNIIKIYRYKNAH
jgi:hypothetical protein